MRHKVLLVDDDPDARSIFGAALQERGYELILAVNGAEAVHLARRHKPDLILMDIRMPVMDAWEALKYLRSDHKTAGKPIWAISAYLDQESGSQGLGNSFDRLFAKPLDPHVLVEAVDGYFGRSDEVIAREAEPPEVG